jgi:hypothetical protein
LIDFRQFVLGYWSKDVQSSPRAGVWADLVRDGSYAAFMWIHQDVAAFEAYLSANAAILAPDLSPAQARELLAAKMMGRWRDGTPLALSPAASDPALATANAFGYADDPLGDKCPLAAHVRVANRRDEPLTPAVAPTVGASGPHLMRRGMAYGPELKGEADDGADRGLVGMFLCASLRRQFFLVMNWINKTDFSPSFAPDRLRRQDMIAGDRATPNADTGAAIRMQGRDVALAPLPQLVRIQGTLLLLLLGIKGLQRIAS